MKKEYRLKTKEYYAQQAKVYSTKTVSWRLQLIDKYNSNDKKIVDLGCGTGNYLLALRNKNVSGIDLSKESIAKLKSRKEYEDSKNNINLVVGDLCNLPFKRDEFDISFSFSTLYYVKEIAKVIGEISRITKKNGVSILEFGNKISINSFWDRVMFSVPQFHWSKKYIRFLMEKNGFEILEIRYRNLIPDFYKLFDKKFIKNRFLQKFCFRMIFIIRKK